MDVSNNPNEAGASMNSDDEFVVPHMNIVCLQNSLAYQKVLEEPWTYLHNWNTLSPSVQQELAQSFLSTLGGIKAELAVTQGVFDPYTVSPQGTSEISQDTTPDTIHPADSQV